MYDQDDAHLVVVDKERNCVVIFQVMPDGRKILFTEYPLPEGTDRGWTDSLVKLAHNMGEDLLMASSTIRKRFLL
jgi:hypothetical protein